MKTRRILACLIAGLGTFCVSCTVLTIAVIRSCAPGLVAEPCRAWGWMMEERDATPAELEEMLDRVRARLAQERSQ